MVSNQIYLFLIFVANGILIGIFFDFFRICRISFKTKDITTYFQDFLFWILTCFSILYFIFVFNNGEIRFFMFMAIVLGITIYMLTFSAMFIKANVTIIAFIKNILTKTIKILLTPLKSVKKIFFKPISFIFINIRKSLKSILVTFRQKTKNNVKNLKYKKDF